MHAIRLRGPWTISDSNRQHSVKLPTECSQIESLVDRDQFSLTRTFHAPSGISPETKIELLIRSAMKVEAVTLNDQALAIDQQNRYPVGSTLRDTNVLVIALSHVKELPTTATLLDAQLLIED